MSPSPSPVIEVRDIRRSFRSAKKGEGLKGAFDLLLHPKFEEHHALKGVSFTIETGSFNGLIGANGAGKTTLLKILSGLIPPSSGEARVLGMDPFKRTLDFRRKIALVMGQKAQLWWDLPALDAFALLQAIYEIPERDYRERLETLTELLDVKRHLQTQIRRLSLGERMKMELIGAILHWPSVIFLDEPTIGLDVLAAHKLREFLRVFNQREKATIILTSHNMDDIERLCSRVIILRSGEMIYDGKPEGLTGKGQRQLRVRLMGDHSVERLSQVTGLAPALISKASSADTETEGEEGADSAPFLFSLSQEQIIPTLQKLMHDFQLVDMGIQEVSLEHVIQRIFEEPRSASPEAPGKPR